MKPLPAIAILPNLITLGNLACGFMAISLISDADFAQNSRFMWAGWLIFAGMVFDLFDGRVARMIRHASTFGKELDSLADMVTFCTAPALLSGQMVRMLVAPDHPRIAWIFSGLFAACGALRLARYNAETHESTLPKRYFVGLPSPAAAGVISAMALVFIHLLDTHQFASIEAMRESPYIWIVRIMPMAAMICGGLMVSRFRYVHAGNVMLRGKAPFLHLVALIFLLTIFLSEPEYTLLAIFGSFACSGPVLAARRIYLGLPREEEQHTH